MPDRTDPTHLTAYRNSEFAVRLTYERGGEGVDLSGAMGRFQVRESAGGDLLSEATTINGRLVMDADGNIDVVCPREDMTFDRAVWGCAVDLGDGEDVLLTGTLELKPGIVE